MNLLLNSFLVLLTMTWSSISAQENPFIPLFPTGKIPNSTVQSPAKLKEVSQIGNDQNERISGVSIPAMKYYPAAPQKRNGTAVIICPGGGYSILSMTHEGEKVAKKFAEQGIAAFVLKYRLPSDLIMQDKSKGPLQDAQQALKLVREQASTYQVDPHKIGIMGFSAGGHLASSAAVHYRDITIDNPAHTSLRPDFALLIYPVITMDSSLTHAGSRNKLLGEHPSDSLVHYFSNDTQVDRETPPTFLVHAEDDRSVPIVNSEAFYKALQRYQIPSQLIRYPQGGHGFGLHNKTTQDLWFDHALEWLHQLNF